MLNAFSLRPRQRPDVVFEDLTGWALASRITILQSTQNIVRLKNVSATKPNN